ncbi:MAG: NAD(+) synthase [Desulfovibrionaceae bacterium]|nr:NAD(+) synthase [Desulfovibrionaceae bacterium]
MAAFKLVQMEGFGYDLKAKTQQIIAKAQAIGAGVHFLSLNALCPLDLFKLQFANAYLEHVPQSLELIAKSLDASQELFLVTYTSDCNLALYKLTQQQITCYPLKLQLCDPHFTLGYSYLEHACCVVVLFGDVCRDLKLFAEKFLQLMQHEAQVIENIVIIAALNWVLPGTKPIETCILDLAYHLKRPIFFLNSLGLDLGRMYYGASFIAGSAGTLLAKAKFLREDVLAPNINIICQDQEPLEQLFLVLVAGLKAFCKEVACKHLFLGLSGGLDSALVLAISAKAYAKDKITPVLMPSPFNAASSTQDALTLCHNLQIAPLTLPITPSFDLLQNELQEALSHFETSAKDVTFENMQARIRGLFLVTLANRAQGIVLNTSNKSEIAMGYSTLYGDTVGAIAVLGDLLKTQVYALAHWYNETQISGLIPETILTKAPSAELRPNQKDTDSLPEYAILDHYLEEIFQGKVPEDTQGLAIYKQVQSQEFKRLQEPPALIVSNYALGHSVRFPWLGRFK